MTGDGAGERGVLMAIGGAEDKGRDRLILRRFVELAGGAAARIAIIPTASSIEGAGQRYKAIFLQLGAAAAEVIYIPDRAAALDPRNAFLLHDTTGIFIGGGNQMRLAAILGGSPLATAIAERHAAGAVIAGTSAGASILSRHMVATGMSGTGPRGGMAQLGVGFGLIDNVIIDQHFRQRDRIGRLLTLVALNPGQLGLGVDEDTAAIIGSDGAMEVLGRGDGYRGRWAADDQRHRAARAPRAGEHHRCDPALAGGRRALRPPPSPPDRLPPRARWHRRDPASGAATDLPRCPRRRR